MFTKGYGIMSTLHDICEYVRSGETEKERLGLEIEHFIINEVGVQITFETALSGICRAIGDLETVLFT